MLMSAITFSRLTIPDWMFFGGRITSCSTPSMRNRTRTSRSLGSMWMSDARSATAWLIRRLTSLTIGDSSLSSLTLTSSISDWKLLDASAETFSASDITRWYFVTASRIEFLVATATRSSAPVTVRMSSTANTFDGSAMATMSRPSIHPIGRAR